MTRLRAWADYEGTDRDCSNWSMQRRELSGCGSSCGCLRMDPAMRPIAATGELVKLLEHKLLDLDSVDSEQYDAVTEYLSVVVTARAEKEERKKMIDRALGR